MSSSNPSWLKKYLSDQEATDVSKIVRTMEEKTSGEIVPVVVRRSSTIGHVPLILFPFTFLVGMFALEEMQLGLQPIFILLVNLAFSFALTRLLSPQDFVERFLTPKADQEYQVQLRAESEFYESSIQKTRDKTGILIFVSLMERQVVVLGDKSISDKLSADTWQKVVDEILVGIRTKNLASGLDSGIRHCGEILATHFPIQKNDTNELPNHLIIKER